MLMSYVSSSQNFQNSNWIVGFSDDCYNINFNTPPLDLQSVSLPSQFPEETANFLEGVASVSDQNGNLLLFSDGVRLWKRESNGTINLLTDELKGNNSSAQNVIFIPRPGNPNRYFVVTISGATSPVLGSVGGKGLYFSEVDVNTGIVVLNSVLRTKDELLNNIVSLPIDESFENISEAITSTVHSNGTDYWLVAQIENANLGVVVSYKIDCNGFPQNGKPNNQISLVVEGMSRMVKISRSNVGINTRRIALSNVGPTGTFVGTYNISNGAFSMSTSNFILPGEIKYGIEFSPNSNFLYLTGDGLTCYNLNSNTVGYQTIEYGGEIGLQLALDGRIYSPIGFVINNPDTASVNNINFSNGIQLGEDEVIGPGLPQWVHWQNNTGSTIIASPDSFILTSGSTSNNPVYINDTNNSVLISNLTGYSITITGGVSGITINSLGQIVVSPNTPCGVYNLRYRICNTNTCSTCSNDGLVTVTVSGSTTQTLNVAKDSLCMIAGTTSSYNVLSNDSVNNVSPVIPGAVSVVQVSTTNAGVNVNTNGNVVINSGVPVGSYTVTYKICNNCNNTNCSDVTSIDVKVQATNLIANDDIVVSDFTGSTISNSGLIGNFNVVTNDTSLCNPIQPLTSIILTVLSPNSYFSIDVNPLSPNYGNVIVNPNTPIGTYSLTYQICEASNSSSCSTATVYLTVGIEFDNVRSNGTIKHIKKFNSSNDVLICGNFSSYDSVSRNRVAKLNGDSLNINTTFGTTSNFGPSYSFGQTDLVRAVFIDANDNVYLGGQFDNFNNSSTPRVNFVKLNPSGVIYSNYTRTFNGAVNSIKRQSSDKIIVVGAFRYKQNSVYKKGIARLIDQGLSTDSGLIDPQFNNNALDGTNGNVDDFVILPSGEIVIVGNFTLYNGQAVNGIAKLTSDGLFSSTMGTGFSSVVVNSNLKLVESIIVRGNWIYMVGNFNGSTTFNGGPIKGIIKMDFNGNVNAGFNFGTLGIQGGIAYSLSSDTANDSGNLYLGGTFTHYNGVMLSGLGDVIKISNNGLLDMDYQFNGDANNAVFTTCFQQVANSDRLIVGGSFTNFNSRPANRITRLMLNPPFETIQARELVGFNEEAELTISPNPSFGIFTFNFSKTPIKPTRVAIYNMLGQLLLERTVDLDVVEIDLTNYPTSTYIAKIYDGENIVTKTLIKE